MTPDYYTLLGIARDASDAEIKAGFRRARSSAHPDRNGGDDELMKQVNRAHDCLTDPDRRAVYDATGMDQPSGDEVKELTEQLLDQQAQASLRLLLEQLIDGLDGWELLESARDLTADNIRKLAGTIGKAKGRVTTLTRKLGRVRVKGNVPNLVEEVMQAAIDKANAEVESAEATLRIVQRCQQLLGSYEADKPLPQPRKATQRDDMADAFLAGFGAQGFDRGFGRRGY